MIAPRVLAHLAPATEPLIDALCRRAHDRGAIVFWAPTIGPIIVIGPPAGRRKKRK